MKKLLLGLIILAGSFASELSFSIESDTIAVKDFKKVKVELPIKDATGAINFALELKDVKAELAKPGDWLVSCELYDPKNFKDVWVLVFNKDGEQCGNSHQCSLRVKKDGTVISPFICSDGYNCR